jgi:hypothetical protein
MHVCMHDTVRMLRWCACIASLKTHTDLLLRFRCCFSVRQCLFHLSCNIKGYK